jgi:hypothetical protein
MSEQLAFEGYTSDQVDLLRARTGEAWPHIAAARERSREMLLRLRAGLFPILRPDTACVVFGSLARLEFTDHSDIDWTLLVDGAVDPDHWSVAERIRGRLAEMALPQPTAGGPFGNLTFSHDLIHRIGGDDDTNRNTTQRLLLLLESEPIGTARAYEHVVEQVLARYIEEDLVTARDSPYRVPRFLQNDIARYWRTMAVDFAHKRRARGASGWALRTAKLRLSRKLMYASGLLTCFSCDFLLTERRRGPFGDTQHVLQHLRALVRTTPLDIIARTLLLYFGELSGSGVALFEAYDDFLGLLGDAEKRKYLKNLAPADADGDLVQQEVREIGTRFQNALTEIFLVHDTRVRELTIQYGVF